MKRALIALVVLTLAVAALAATRDLPGPVRDVILRALLREREAVARYEAFAAKATEEGYAGVASLFKAQAQAERTHAERFAALLRNHDVPLPTEQTLSPSAGSTSDNLRAAAMAEIDERDHAYRDAIETCQRAGAADIAKVFDQTRDTEVEHANLCLTAGRQIESMKEAKPYYVCGKCGYTTDIGLRFCPACQHQERLTHVQ